MDKHRSAARFAQCKVPRSTQRRLVPAHHLRKSLQFLHAPHTRHSSIFRESRASAERSKKHRRPSVLQGLKFPLTPQTAIHLLRNILADFNVEEALACKKIWYLPKQSFEEHYDDNKGFYKLHVGDHLAYRYEIRAVLGKGAFGNVCKCFDHKTREEVAVKLIKNKKEYRDQARTELRILEALKQSDPEDQAHCVRLKKHFTFRGHVCIVFELLHINLFTYIVTRNNISLSKIRALGGQLLIALKYLKKLKLVHCDLKPDNIVMTPDRRCIKVIDFGVSCYESERVHYYIQSRFYRAPEIMFGIPYTAAIDMWSFGCILAELWIGTPLFPCRSEEELFSRMVQVIGSPPQSVLAEAKRKDVLHLLQHEDDKGEVYFGDQGMIDKLVSCGSRAFLDLLLKCLDWNPEARLTPSQALAHAFFQGDR